MRHNWLTQLERQYVHSLLDEAIEHVKTRDMKSCAAFVQHAIKSRLKSTSRMRPDIYRQNRIQIRYFVSRYYLNYSLTYFKWIIYWIIF